MLKKLLSILCLLTVATSSNCMEEDNTNSFNGWAGYSKTPVYGIPYNQSGEELKLAFDKLIAKNDNPGVIQFLEDNHSFTSDNLSYILNELSTASFHQAISYINESFVIDIKDQIRCALNLGDIEQVKALTQFNDFVIYPNKLNKMAYLDSLDQLGFKETVLDEILIHDGINYEYSGNRYLQDLIRRNNTESALRFIANAKYGQLDMQEADGSTALHEVKIQWYAFCESNDLDGMSNQESIVQALQDNGASAQIRNHHGLLSSQLHYNPTRRMTPKTTPSTRHDGIRRRGFKPTDHIENFSTQITQPPKPKKSGLSFKELAGLSLVGIAACYLGYRVFKSYHKPKQNLLHTKLNFLR